MAVYRRRPAVQPPGELVTFDAAEWGAPGDALGDWEPGFHRWKAARREWIKQHPDTVLGDPVDLLIGERQAKVFMAGS